MNRSGTTTRPAGGKSVMLRWLGHLGVFGYVGLVCQTMSMAPTCWLDLFTVKTWKEFLDHGGNVSGYGQLVFLGEHHL